MSNTSEVLVGGVPSQRLHLLDENGMRTACGFWTGRDWAVYGVTHATLTSIVDCQRCLKCHARAELAAASQRRREQLAHDAYVKEAGI